MTGTDESSATARDRRAFMAGAAGLAAGAVLAGGAEPAGATAATTTGFVDVSSALKWMNFGASPMTMTTVDLGSGGSCEAKFSPHGDMATMMYRILIGSGADLGTGPWCLDGADSSFSGIGFEPQDMPSSSFSGQVPSSWVGMATVYDVTSVNNNQYAMGCSWSNFHLLDSGLGEKLLVWGLYDRRNNGDGAVMFNYAGQVPYGLPPGAGTVLEGQVTYQIVAI